jgi:hypothetical protein
VRRERAKALAHPVAAAGARGGATGCPASCCLAVCCEGREASSMPVLTGWTAVRRPWAMDAAVGSAAVACGSSFCSWRHAARSRGQLPSTPRSRPRSNGTLNQRHRRLVRSRSLQIPWGVHNPGVGVSPRCCAGMRPSPCFGSLWRCTVLSGPAPPCCSARCCSWRPAAAARNDACWRAGSQTLQVPCCHSDARPAWLPQ